MYNLWEDLQVKKVVKEFKDCKGEYTLTLENFNEKLNCLNLNLDSVKGISIYISGISIDNSYYTIAYGSDYGLFLININIGDDKLKIQTKKYMISIILK